LGLFYLHKKYYLGDIGFDPFGLKPKDTIDFSNMQAKELSNRWLSMLVMAAMCAHEQVNGQ
jgi:hypothetical protein